jgi:hypothetical protein
MGYAKLSLPRWRNGKGQNHPHDYALNAEKWIEPMFHFKKPGGTMP